MGISASNSFVENTVNSLTSVVNTTVSTVTQNIQTNCTAGNQFIGVIGSVPSEIDPNGRIILSNCVPTPDIKQLVVDQTSQNSCGLQGGLTNNVSQTINNQLVLNIDQWLQSDAKANNGFLGFGVSIAAAEGISRINLAQRIANSLTSNLVQNCNAAVTASNSGTVYFCGGAKDGIFITQSAVNTNLTSCIINNTVTAIGNDSVLTGIVQKAAAEADASNEGLWGGLKWIVLIVVILAVVIVIGLLLYFAFGSKSKPKVARPEGEAEKLCILETEEKGASLPPAEKKAFFQKCVIRKEEERFSGGERREGGSQRFGEGGPQRFGEGEGRFGEGEGRFETPFGSFTPYRY